MRAVNHRSIKSITYSIKHFLFVYFTCHAQLHFQATLSQIQTVAKTATIHRNMWVENADRMVAGFLEMFEERCHKMGTAIRDRIQESLRGQNTRGLLDYGEEGDDEEYYYDSEEEYYDDDGYYDSDEKK